MSEHEDKIAIEHYPDRRRQYEFAQGEASVRPSPKDRRIGHGRRKDDSADEPFAQTARQREGRPPGEANGSGKVGGDVPAPGRPSQGNVGPRVAGPDDLWDGLRELGGGKRKDTHECVTATCQNPAHGPFPRSELWRSGAIVDRPTTPHQCASLTCSDPSHANVTQEVLDREKANAHLKGFWEGHLAGKSDGRKEALAEARTALAAIFPPPTERSWCLFFHRWGKWESYEWAATKVAVGNRKLDPPYDVTALRQKRTCTRCGLEQDRLVRNG